MLLQKFSIPAEIIRDNSFYYIPCRFLVLNDSTDSIKGKIKIKKKEKWVEKREERSLSGR